MDNQELNILKDIFNYQSTQTLVEKPCRITKVHSPYMASVKYKK